MLNLNIPKILPDELGTAYLEHVARGNTLTTVELLSRVRNARPRSHRPSKAQLIAEIAKLSDQDFVCSHTCKPFYGAFESSMQWCHPHGVNERWVTHNPMLHPRRIGYYFCPQCASEDVKFWGRSYWRRSHQIAVLYDDPDEAASLISPLSGTPSRYQSQPSDQDAVKMNTLTADI